MRREPDWIWHDRVALFLVIGVPLLAFAVLSLTFSNAVIRDLGWTSSTRTSRARR